METTLLGSDDKSGIAEIMTAIEYLVAHPELNTVKSVSVLDQTKKLVLELINLMLMISMLILLTLLMVVPLVNFNTKHLVRQV